MQTKSHPIEPEDLMAYLDDELPPAAAASVAEHVGQCPECQALAGDLQRVSRGMAAWKVEPSGADLKPRVAAALDERTPAIPRLRRLPPWAWALAGACVVLVVIVAAVTSLPAPARYQLAMQQRAGSALLSAPAPPPSASGSAAPRGPMIARTAGLSLVAADFNRARASLDVVLARHHGYLRDLNLSAPPGAGRTLTATLMVPADELEATLAELRKLGRVESETQTGEEVTAQYVDLEARLANARNTAQRLTELLRDRTARLSDVLAVETELDRVRGSIESMEAERKALAGRVAFASVNLTLAEEYKAQLQPLPDSTWTRFRNAAIQGYHGVADSLLDALLAAIAYGPALLLWGALLFFAARFLWRRLRPRGI